MEALSREYEKALSHVQRLIENGALKTGDKLPTERALSETLSISRNSTREALRTLEHMGVIESRQGSGNYLRGDMTRSFSNMLDMMLLMRATTPRELCQFRRGMEKTTCEMLLALPDLESRLSELPPLLRAFEAATPEKLSELDRQFHFVLIHAVGNQLLSVLMDALTEIYRRWILTILTTIDEPLRLRLEQLHSALYEALLRRDESACMDAINRHYDIIDQQLGNR